MRLLTQGHVRTNSKQKSFKNKESKRKKDEKGRQESSAFPYFLGYVENGVIEEKERIPLENEFKFFLTTNLIHLILAAPWERDTRTCNSTHSTRHIFQSTWNALPLWVSHLSRPHFSLREGSKNLHVKDDAENSSTMEYPTQKPGAVPATPLLDTRQTELQLEGIHAPSVPLDAVPSL